MDVVIREASPDDAEALGPLHLAAWREAYTDLLPATFWADVTEERFTRNWRANLTDLPVGVTTVLALRGDQAVGFATSGPARADTAVAPVRERELWALYVRATEYGSGLAPELLRRVLPDDVPAEVWVFEANPRARAFYAKHGLSPDGGRMDAGPELGNRPEIRMVR